MLKLNKKNITILIILFLIMLILSAGFVCLAICVRKYGVLSIDETFINLSLNMRRGWLNVIFEVITNLGNPIVIAILSIIILFFSKSKKHLSFALFLNLGITALLMLVLKFFFKRIRPNSDLSLINETGYSFPSGHTMLAIAFYGFLIYFIWQLAIKRRFKIFSTISFVLLIILISYSRVYLGVHYISDVLGAIFISSTYLIIFVYVVNNNHKIVTEDKLTYKNHTFLQGFKYAFRGIYCSIIEENNLLVQFSASMLVIVFGVALRISFVEWCICLILCFLVMALEMVNTAIENICDRITKEEDNAIRKIKDISAGAVLTLSICSVIVAMIIFIPKMPFLFSW